MDYFPNLKGPGPCTKEDIILNNNSHSDYSMPQYQLKIKTTTFISYQEHKTNLEIVPDKQKVHKCKQDPWFPFWPPGMGGGGGAAWYGG